MCLDRWNSFCVFGFWSRTRLSPTLARTWARYGRNGLVSMTSTTWTMSILGWKVSGFKTSSGMPPFVGLNWAKTWLVWYFSQAVFIYFPYWLLLMITVVSWSETFLTFVLDSLRNRNCPSANLFFCNPSCNWFSQIGVPNFNPSAFAQENMDDRMHRYLWGKSFDLVRERLLFAA